MTPPGATSKTKIQEGNQLCPRLHVFNAPPLHAHWTHCLWGEKQDGQRVILANVIKRWAKQARGDRGKDKSESILKQRGKSIVTLIHVANIRPKEKVRADVNKDGHIENRGIRARIKKSSCKKATQEMGKKGSLISL